MSVKNSVKPLLLASRDASTLTANYQIMSSNGGIEGPAFFIKIINNTSVDVTISYDGVNDHDIVRTMTDTVINFQANSQPNNYNALLPMFTKVYAKGTAGTGKIYISGWTQNSGQGGV